MIEFHAHAMLRAYVAFLRARGISIPTMPLPPLGVQPPSQFAPISDASEDMATRVLLMNGAGVAEQILSPTFAPYFDDEALAVEAAVLLNDTLSATAAFDPPRFLAYASLPLPHIDAALAEMTRALDRLKMAGVTLQCFCGHRSVAHAYFDPLYAEMHRRGATLFVHPCTNGLCSRFITDWGLAGAAGPTFEDSVIAMHLMITGIPAHYDSLKIVIPHLGGGLTTLLDRLDNQLPYFARLSEPPSQTARRMWYDSCCHGSRAAFRCAVEALGADRIVPGSDYPFLTRHKPYRDTLRFIERMDLPEEGVHTIPHRNARLLFPHPMS